MKIYPAAVSSRDEAAYDWWIGLRSVLSLADEKLRLHPLLLDCIIEHLFIFMICPWQSRNQDAKHEYNPLTVRSCEFIIIEEVKLMRSH